MVDLVYELLAKVDRDACMSLLGVRAYRGNWNHNQYDLRDDVSFQQVELSSTYKPRVGEWTLIILTMQA